MRHFYRFGRLAPIILFFFMLASGCGGLGSGQNQNVRYYNDVEPLKTDNAILSPDDSSWIKINDTARRKVFYGDGLSMEIVEWARSGLTGNIATERRLNDIIGYITAGAALVTVGEKTRQIATGGVFIVPSNTPYGVIPASDKTTILFAYTPPREDLRPPAPRVKHVSDNEIKAVIYKWFALFDERAPVLSFETCLAQTGLRVEMADKKTLNSVQDFRKWHTQWLSVTDTFTSTVESITVDFDPTTGHYLANAVVSRTTKTHAGKKGAERYEICMELSETRPADAPRIIAYREKPIKK